jgi:IclR family acetate operon transcriptional repressor
MHKIGGPTESDRVSEVTSKIFQLLEALSCPEAGVPLEELTERIHLPKTTVYRLLYSMSKLGYVEQNPATNRYLLSQQFFDLGPNRLPYKRLAAIARPLMEELLCKFEESVNLAVMHAGILIYILVLEGKRSHRAAATVGGHAHLHCTSVGKCIAAHLSPADRQIYLSRYGMPAMTSSTITSPEVLDRELELIRSEGVALDKAENTDGILCIGGPILSSPLTPGAAISVSGPMLHMCEELPRIKEAVRDISMTISAQFATSASESKGAITPNRGSPQQAVRKRARGSLN